MFIAYLSHVADDYSHNDTVDRNSFAEDNAKGRQDKKDVCLTTNKKQWSNVLCRFN